MRFWPFGNDKDGGDVEFASRVVTGEAADGATLRGKITAHFASPRRRDRADELADAAAGTLRATFENAPAATDLLGAEAALAASVLETLPREEVRSIDVVAVHVVGDTVQPAPAHLPSSRPPPPTATPAPRRMSSSQMLAVRDSRLIPEGASTEVVGDAIVPLLRDASTRTLVGVLRAYDLSIVRHVEIDPRASGDFGELVPQSTAAPGRFADERADELARWEAKLGGQVMNGLKDESATVVVFFLHSNLSGSGLDPKLVVGILERAAASAFPGGAPLANLARYLQGAHSSSAQELAARTLAMLGAEAARVDAFTTVITPTLQSLQDDFAFVAQQIMLSGVRSA